MNKSKIILFVIPIIFFLIGGVLFIISFIIPDTLNGRLYNIDISAEPTNNNLTQFIFNQANFYYDFTKKEGSFKFSSPTNINRLYIRFPSEIIDSSLKVYTVQNCLTNSSYCNKTEVFFQKEINSYNGSNFYELPDPSYSIAIILFKNFTINKRYLIEFKLKNFEPSGIIHFFRTEREGLQVVLNPDNDGNLMFNLGNNYDCKNCFYNEDNLKLEYWSYGKFFRLSIPEKGRTNPNASFRIDTIPVFNMRLKNIFFDTGLTIAFSALSIILTFLLELIYKDKDRKKELEESENKIVNRIRKSIYKLNK